MKMKILITLGLCLALTLAVKGQAKAQTDSSKKHIRLELRPFAGIRLLNGTTGAVFGGSAMYPIAIHRNKQLKLGVEYTLSTYGSYEDDKFTRFSSVHSYDLKVLTTTAFQAWMGITIGMMQTNSATGPLHNRVKVGLAAELRHFGIGVDFFKTEKQQQNLGITAKYIF